MSEEGVMSVREERIVTCDVCGERVKFDTGCRMGGHVIIQHTAILPNSFTTCEQTVDYCEACFGAGRVGVFVDHVLAERNMRGESGYPYGSRRES